MGKSVSKDEDQPMLPLIFTHVYDTVEINSAVPWDELDESSQRLAKKVVDYYRMQASIKVDAQIDIQSLNIESDDEDEGMLFSLVACVEALGDNEIDYEGLFSHDNDEQDLFEDEQ
jgi:hypothetical protein